MSRRPNQGGQLRIPVGSGRGPVALTVPSEMVFGRAERRRSEKLSRQALKSVGVRTLKAKAE